MAVDKLVDSTQLDADLTSIANAIRTKGGTSASLAFPADFVNAIGDIETGGGSNPNYMQTINGTAANPWGDVDFEKLSLALENRNATAILDMDASALGVTDPIMNYLIGNPAGNQILANGANLTNTPATSYTVVWTKTNGLILAYMDLGTGITNIAPYASMIPTTLTIVWHQLDGGPSGTKQISVTSNGTKTEDVSAYANAQVAVNVPNSYSASDEGKVVSNGALVAQGSDTVNQNGTVDTTLISSLLVNVSGGGSSVASGTFTPTENLGEIDLEALGVHTLTHFMFKMVSATLPEGNSVRTCVLGYADFTAGTYASIGTNSGGTSINSTAFSAMSSNSPIKRENNKLKVNQSGAGAGNIRAGVTYEWFAW